MQPGSGGYRAVGWRVYRLYHKLRSAGGDNVWCTHCDWREQPPPSNPASPVTWYQRERHSSAGKAIPCSRSVFCTSRPSLDSFPPQFISIAFLLFHFLVLSLSFIPSFSPPTHCPLHLAVRMWPYLGLWEGVAVGAGGRREGGVWDYHHGDAQSRKRKGRSVTSSFHTFPFVLLQWQQGELEEELGVNIKGYDH